MIPTMKGPTMESQKEPFEMTDREIAEETLAILRTFAQTFMAMSQNPMLRAMMPGM